MTTEGLPPISPEDMALIHQRASEIKGGMASVAPQNENTVKEGVDLSKPWTQLFDNELPSGGIAYPAGYTLQFRKYSFEELEVINRSAASPATRIRMFSSGIKLQAEGREITDRVTYIDFDLICMLRKMRSLGASTEFTLQNLECPVCNKALSKKFRMDKIEFPELKTNVPKLPVKYSLKNGIELPFSLLTIKDMIEILDLDLPEEKERLWSLARMSQNAGNQMKHSDILAILKKVDDIEDIDVLIQIYDLLNIEVPPFIIECSGTEAEPHPEHKLEVPYSEVSESLLKPFRPAGGAISNKIRFGAEG